MKLSEYHAAHGLEVILRSRKSGEQIHLRFDKGQARVPIAFESAGHHAEAAFVLSKKMDVPAHYEFDLSLDLVVAPHPGGNIAQELVAPKVAPKDLPMASSLPQEPRMKLKDTTLSSTIDGAEMKAASKAVVIDEFEVDMAIETPRRHPMSAMTSIKDPKAVPMEGSHTEASGLGGLKVVASDQPSRTPADVHVEGHDDAKQGDPMAKENAEAATELQHHIAESKAFNDRGKGKEKAKPGRI